MESYIKRFPKQGNRETVELKIIDDEIVASGIYMVLDYYCTNPDCDSNHILLSVIMVKPPIKTPMALLNYSWNDNNLKKFDLQVENSIEKKSIHGAAFRDIMEEEIRTSPSYAKLLRKRFQQFRASLPPNGDSGTCNHAHGWENL